MLFSQFKINKKLTFSNGKAKVNNNNLQDEEINFKELNFQLLKFIQESVLSDVTDETTDNEILFKILPHLTDIQMDVTFQEFNEMMLLPSKELCQLCDVIIDEINLIIDTVKNISELSEKSKKVTKKINRAMPK
jgi:hypothetical protein